MTVFSNPAFDNHEQVVFCNDPKVGLKAIIAVHSTAIGPAVGGCRMWAYESEAEALTDVLRLSRGMSYKNAMTEISLGGGKAVIIGDSRTQKTPELMRAFGHFVDGLGGKYITAEDMGMTAHDMEYVAQTTRFVTGLNSGKAASGDPSPFTAHGVFSGIRAAANGVWGDDNLSGRRVLVQGIGHVGFKLARELTRAGATVYVCDIFEDNVRRAVSEFGATAVATDQIFTTDAEIFAPCAMGAVIDDEALDQMKFRAIAGAANNQLAEDRHGLALHQRGILYAPDYVINAGGMMSVANEVNGVAVDTITGMRNVEHLYDALSEIFARSKASDRPTSEVADAIAEGQIASARKANGRATVAA